MGRRFLSFIRNFRNLEDAEPVSYTHLDVYKRQHYNIRDVFCEKEIPDIPVTGGLCWEEEGNCQEFTGASLHLSEEDVYKRQD